MIETEPQYFKEFRKHFDEKLEEKLNENFTKTKELVEKEIGSLAISTANEFRMIREEMATKEDLKNFATKEDLKNFATKEDLKNFATKEDLEEVKKELESVKNIAMETKDGLEEVKNTMATKEHVEKILAHIGAYEVRSQNTEKIVLKDHKPRIRDLERVVFVG